MTTSLPVRQRIADIARDAPDRPALIGFDADLAEVALSWRELADRVAESASRTTGPYAVVEAANTVDAAVAIAAALAAEVPVFPLNPATPPAERDVLLAQLASRFDREDHGVAYLLATGASAGIPKIAARPGPLRYDPRRTPSLVIRQTGWRTGQRHLVVGPLYHAAPFTSFVDAILDANTVVLQRFFAPRWTVDLIREHRVEWAQLTPTHMREILTTTPDPAHFDSLRAVLHTAAKCDDDTKRGWLDLLGPERVFELYGATEGIGVTLARGDEWLSHPGTVGRGVLTRIRIQDDAGRPTPPGTPGTVYLRTPDAITRADYLDRRTVRTTPDGFATVGDRGRLDADGYLYLEPRAHDTINVGGEKVDPDEVESALRHHHAVLDAVALAVPHETLGSVVGVHVVLRPDRTARRAELAAHCGRLLAGYKIPKHFTFVDQLPRTAAGKIQRWRLSPDSEGGAPPR
ncbi:AMP-binding protein [Actinosynnema sp. CA-299493]